MPPPAAPAGNPLQKYFRMPGMLVRLPTNGAFLPPGAIAPVLTGEVPVLPMRGQDELLLKSPDALMSGYAIEKLLESCVPAITTPRLVATPDFDVLMLTIRVATYGPHMELHARCPKCQEDTLIDCDLPAMLATAQTIPPDISVRLSDEVLVYLRPYNISNATTVALGGFAEARKLQAFEARGAGLSEQNQRERSEQVGRSMEVLAKLSFAALSDCVIRVVAPEIEVTDPALIGEFLANIPKAWLDKVEAKLTAVNAMGLDKHIAVHCGACQHEWQTEVEFDPSTFFANSSSA